MNGKRAGLCSKNIPSNRSVDVLLPLSVLLLFFTLSVSCSTESPGEPEYELPSLPIGSRRFETGIAGIVSRNYPNSSDQDFRDFLDELPLMGERSGTYAAWDASYPITDLVRVIETYSEVTVLAAIGFDHERVDATYFQTIGEDYKNAALALANEFDLDYLAVGIEVNRVRDECCQEAFDGFMALYGEIYDEIKNASPGTKVCTVFQLDYMKGAARLSGLELEPGWDMLDLFEGKFRR
jgi:hypothetical protein